MAEKEKTKEQLIEEVKALQMQVAELEQTKSEHKQAEKELENIFSLSPDMIAICTPEGRFLKVSHAWEKVLGYKTGEILKLGWAKLVHPDDVDATNKEVERQLKGGSTVNFTNRFRSKDGTYKTFEWQATSSIDGIVYATARDTTERRQAEEELKQKMRELETFHKVAVGRELKMVELKKRVKELEEKLGEKL